MQIFVITLFMIRILSICSVHEFQSNQRRVYTERIERLLGAVTGSVTTR